MGTIAKRIGGGAVTFLLAAGILAGGTLAAQGSDSPHAAHAADAPAHPLARASSLATSHTAKSEAGRPGTDWPVPCGAAMRALGERPANGATNATAAARAAAESAAAPSRHRSPETERPAGPKPASGAGNGTANSANADAAAPAPDAPATEDGVEALAPRTLVVNGVAIPYCDVRGGTTPDVGAGLWLGSDSVTDGSWGYFVGHNPGPFAPVKRLRCGSTVVLCDSAGNDRAYEVCAVFTVEASATWKTIASRVTGYGESVVLQTCTGDGVTNTIVVAA